MQKYSMFDRAVGFVCRKIGRTPKMEIDYLITCLYAGWKEDARNQLERVEKLYGLRLD